MTCLCGLYIIILEIWELVHMTFKRCFVIKLLNAIAKNYREVYKKVLKKSIIKFLQEIFQSINA